MVYLYHRVPEKLYGNILYPLSQLKDKYPKLYNEEFSKYSGREDILNDKIPILNCLWSEVLHFSIVNPKDIYSELRDAGSKIKGKTKWYKIDPKKLDKKHAVIYSYKSRDFLENDFEKYYIKKLNNYSKLPNKTKEYYKFSLEKGRKPLLFHFVPHVLYNAGFDVKNLEIVEID